LFFNLSIFKSLDSRVLKNFIHNHLISYPTPLNLNYSWGFGSLLGLFLVIQIISGILLAMHYTPHISLAFASVEHIMRDLNNGWLIRYIHANGASFLFVFLYLHLFRNLYYSSYVYPYNLLWHSGVLLFVLMMATAYMGYVLPFGQMSFWGATVIINLFTTIPIWGDSIVQWILGGYAVENSTLNRFFSLHYLVPFLIAGVTLIHLTLLHVRGSNNPLGLSYTDKIPFYPYFYLKDLFGFITMFFIFLFIVFYYPNMLGHPDNYVEANALVTPLHIVPEWYFLPFYAILRSIPSKVGGVICMGLSIGLFFFLPLIKYLTHIFLFYSSLFDNKRFIPQPIDYLWPLYIPSESKSPRFRFFYSCVVYLFIWNLIWLGYIGGHPVAEPNLSFGQIATLIYFLFFLVFVPLTLVIENFARSEVILSFVKTEDLLFLDYINPNFLTIPEAVANGNQQPRYISMDIK
jgi:quinol-cytochrome oxidoreductase complex cytochrome b subunit